MRQRFPMILIRVIVGLVFLTEGILKFLRPDELGAGRFTAIGLPYPHMLAPLVGGVEIGAGAAVLLNIFAGDAALLLLVVILTALATTKLPIVHKAGWMSFLHEARTDLCMIAGTLAVLIDSGLKVGRRRRWYQSKEL